MTLDIIVTGALGRMGSTIIGLVGADPDLALVGVVERPTCRESLTAFVCSTGTDLAELLPQKPKAVVIDFTAPDASVQHAKICAAHGNPLVIGATGINPDQRAEIAAAAQKAPILWSPNMSVGVNTLLKILPTLVQLLGENYDLEMTEIHHNKKKDAPSGTALKLAECLAEARGWNLDDVGNYGRQGLVGERPHKEIGVQTIRGGDVVGVHTFYFLGPGERIEITHQAHSRENFASGAIRAAKWLANQPAGRLYSMNDVL